MTADDLNRWARIRALLTQAEAALLFNACQDKANGDREAANSIHPDALGDPGTLAVRQTLYAQADLAEVLADQVLS